MKTTWQAAVKLWQLRITDKRREGSLTTATCATTTKAIAAITTTAKVMHIAFTICKHNRRWKKKHPLATCATTTTTTPTEITYQQHLQHATCLFVDCFSMFWILMTKPENRKSKWKFQIFGGKLRSSNTATTTMRKTKQNLKFNVKSGHMQQQWQQHEVCHKVFWSGY